jgi:hypothetical protein
MVSLTKILASRAATISTLLNTQIVRCPLCGQTYRLEYGEGEGHHLSAWLKKADTAMRESHKRDNHKMEKLKLR